MRALDFLKGDFVLKSNGRYSTVSGAQKVKRDIIKLFVTNIDDSINPTRYNPKYGIALSDKKNFSNMSKTEVIDKIKALIKSSLEYYVSIQKAQSNAPYDEVVQHFDYIVYEDAKVKTLINANVSAQMVSGETLDLKFYQTI